MLMNHLSEVFTYAITLCHCLGCYVIRAPVTEQVFSDPIISANCVYVVGSLLLDRGNLCGYSNAWAWCSGELETTVLLFCTRSAKQQLGQLVQVSGAPYPAAVMCTCIMYVSYVCSYYWKVTWSN